MAIVHGLCAQWQREWGNPDLAGLCDKYIRGLDFCIKHDFPSIEYMEKHFRGKVEDYGIYINDDMVSVNQKNVVIIGSSHLTIQTDRICDVTVLHNSKVEIEATGNAFVYVSMHHNSHLVILRKSSSASVCVSYFGGKIETPEMIDKIHNKVIGG